MAVKIERTLRLSGNVVPLLVGIVEKAYFESKEPAEKKLLAGVLSKLQ
jgi:hypothetical protein